MNSLDDSNLGGDGRHSRRASSQVRESMDPLENAVDYDSNGDSPNYGRSSGIRRNSNTHTRRNSEVLSERNDSPGEDSKSRRGSSTERSGSFGQKRGGMMGISPLFRRASQDHDGDDGSGSGNSSPANMKQRTSFFGRMMSGRNSMDLDSNAPQRSSPLVGRPPAEDVS